MNSVYEFFLMTWPVWAFAAIVGVIVIAAERMERKRLVEERRDLRESALVEAEKVLEEEQRKLAEATQKKAYN